MQYKITGQNETATVSAVLDGTLYVADSSHPNFDDIVNGLLDGEPESDVADLFDIEGAVSRQFEVLSERVSFKRGKVYFDGDLVDSVLSDQIARFIEQGEGYEPLVKFMENAYQNPNEHSREQLFTWLRDRDFAITEDGNFLAYKSVYSGNDDNDFDYRSVSAGRAIVNGVDYTGQIPQSIGSVVEMPRSEVQHDPRVGCHTGLHAGTLEYASTFGGDTVLLVEINPRDVVSVPTDCNAQKIRTCRYTVKGISEGAVTRVVVRENPYDPVIKAFTDIFEILWGDGEGGDD